MKRTDWITLDEKEGIRIRYISNIEDINIILNIQAFRTETMLI